MHSNQYGQVLRDEQEVIDLLYQNPNLDFSKINFTSKDVIDKFNHSANLCDLAVSIHGSNDIIETLQEFDTKHQTNWFLPDEYKEFDIEIWLYEHCTTEIEFERVKLEYELFKKHDMIMVLRAMKYLVDTFRQHNVVWGVGRGSSVASYCLYLLGIHKVNSIHYNLDIGEFLK